MKIDERLEDYYNSSEQYLAEMRSHEVSYFDSYLKLVEKIGKDLPSILDLGCGSGLSTYHLARRFPAARCVGIDISTAAIEYASAHYTMPNLSYEVRDVRHLVFPEESFYACCALDCLEHVPDLPRAIDELIRVTAPGGYLVIKGPNHLNPLYTLRAILTLQRRYPFTASWTANFPRLVGEVSHIARGLAGAAEVVEREPDLSDTVQVGDDADAVNEMSNLYMRNLLRTRGLVVRQTSFPRTVSRLGMLISEWLPPLGSMGVIARKPE